MTDKADNAPNLVVDNYKECLDSAIAILKETLHSSNDEAEKELLLGGIDRFKEAKMELGDSEEHPDVEKNYTDIVTTLYECYKGTGDEMLLEEIVKLERKSLSVHPPGHPRRADSCADLAVSLMTLYGCNDNDSYLEEAIQLQQESLSLTSQDHPNYATYAGNLASSLKMQYENTGDDELLIEVIRLRRGCLLLRPPGHTSRAIFCGNLASSLNSLFRATGDHSLLLEAIELQRESVTLHPPGNPHHATSCGNLAALLKSSYDITGDSPLLLEAIELMREVISLRPPRDPHRAISCTSLANSLRACYQSTGSDQLMIEAIEFGRESLSLCPPGHPHRPESCGSLASSLMKRYDSTGDENLLTEAVELLQQSLALRPPGHPARASACSDLAACLGRRYDSVGDELVLAKILDLERESLALRPSGHPDRLICCLNLAGTLLICYRSTGDDVILAEVIDLHREAVSLCPPGHPHRGSSCTSLATSLQTRYSATHEDHLLKESIQLQREALTLRPPGHPNHATSCGELANLLMLQYESCYDDQLLIEAIALERTSFSLLPMGHPNRAISCGNLASTLQTRFGRTRDERLLIEAIDLAREAVALHPSGHPDRATSCANLAFALSTYYEITNNVQLLLEAIKYEQEVLSLRPAGHPSRATSCGNLADSLLKCWKGTHDERYLKDAVSLQQESLSLRPAGHPEHAASCNNLAGTLWNQYKSVRNIDNSLLSDIHTISRRGLSLSHPNSAWRHASLLARLHLQFGSAFFDPQKAQDYLTQCLAHHPDLAYDAVLSVVSSLDELWKIIAENDQVAHCAAFCHVYKQLIRLLPFLNNPALLTRSQLQVLRRSSGVGYDAFVNAMLAGDWTSGLEDMEMAQGLLWSQRLHFRDPDLQELPRSLATELEERLRALGAPSTAVQGSERITASLTPQDIHHNRAAQVHAVLQRIRAIEGMERFMLGETYATLSCVGNARNPVVVLVGARNYAYAIVLPLDSTMDAPLSLDWIEEDFNLPLSGRHTVKPHRGAHDDHEEPVEEVNSRGAKMKKMIPPTPLSRRMRHLWIKLVQPVLKRLGIQPAKGQARPRLHWCLTGKFSALPLHAAGIHDGPIESHVCCTDYVVSSYIPNLTTLLRIQKSMIPMPKDSIRMALVAEKKAQEARLHVIHQVEAEIDNIVTVSQAALVQITHRLSGSTTVLSTCNAMEAANVVHLACHGIQDADDATRSGFCLGDGRLTIGRLMELKMDKAFLAFLSACETAKGDKDQPDQAMHLAAAMIFTGFKAVIATMWAITDDDGPKVAKWFYEELFNAEVIDANSAACALDTAASKLRDSGVSLDRWSPFIHMGV